MQSRQPTTPTCRHGLLSVILTCILSLAGLSLGQPIEASSLALSDGQDSLITLPFGSDLHVGASGLTPGDTVQVTLLDWADQVIVQQERVVDGLGELPSEVLWFRTGVGGCSCKILGHGYPFETFDEAAHIMGLTVTVQLVDPMLDVVLASEELPIVENTEPLIFLADLMSCPREIVQDDDTILLISDGATAEATVFLVEHRPNWQVGVPFTDVRQGMNMGQSFPASAQGWNQILWSGQESVPGKYDVLIRWNDEDDNNPNPQGQVFTDSDQILPGLDPKSRNGGLVIDDWGCGAHSDIGN